MGKPEAYVEGYLVRRAKKRGFLCLKFTAPGVRGVPDRLLITPSGTFFIELKAEGEKLRPQQVHRIAEMRAAGAIVHVIDSREGVDALLDSIP